MRHKQTRLRSRPLNYCILLVRPSKSISQLSEVEGPINDHDIREHLDWQRHGNE